MTAPLFADTYGEVDLNLLKKFQTKTGICLPESYRNFFAETNGGRPSRCWFYVPGWPGEQSCIDKLFGVHLGQHDSVELWYRELQDRLPVGFVPVGIDLGGNFICISTADPDSGMVYYWDASPDWNLSFTEPTMFAVGNAIQQFLADLREEPLS